VFWTIALIVIGIAATTLLLLDRNGPLGWSLATLTFVILFSPLCTAAHEAGHVIAAKILGFEVFEVNLGSGGQAWSGRIAGVSVVLKRFPFSGATIAASRTPKLIRIRRLVFLLGGPAVNLGLVAGYLASASPAFSGAPTTLLVAAGSGFLWTNLLQFAGNLMPFYAHSAYGRVPSDGLGLLLTSVANRDTRKLWVVGYYTSAWHFARSSGDKQAALHWAEAGIAAFPDSALLINALAVSLIDVGMLGPARDQFSRLTEEKGQDARGILIAKNNVAYCDCLLEANLAQADRYSSEIVGVFPWQPHFNGTRGAVLLGMGRANDAVEFLEKAIHLHTDNAARWEAACFLAIAHADLGDRARAREYLDLARDLDADNIVLARARRALADKDPVRSGEPLGEGSRSSA
jgi:hypothetical protein